MNVRMPVEVPRKIGTRPVKRRAGFGRKNYQLPGSGLSRRFGRWSLLDDHVRIGSSYAERTDSGAARIPIGPFGKLGIYPKRTVGEIDLGIGLREVQTGWNQPVP